MPCRLKEAKPGPYYERTEMRKDGDAEDVEEASFGPELRVKQQFSYASHVAA
jgi:hypothetical protein